MRCSTLSREKRNKYYDSDFETALNVYEKEKKKLIDDARSLSYLDRMNQFR